jgi:hypothetical protein
MNGAYVGLGDKVRVEREEPTSSDGHRAVIAVRERTDENSARWRVVQRPAPIGSGKHRALLRAAREQLQRVLSGLQQELQDLERDGRMISARRHAPAAHRTLRSIVLLRS